MRNLKLLITIAGLSFIFSSCGAKSAKASISATARFVNGPTTASTLLTNQFNKKISPLALPADGKWLLSPDKETFTVKKIALTATDGTQTSVDVDCKITTDASAEGLSVLKDCPFSIAAGTYDSIMVTLSTTFDVRFNDIVNNFYSTASGIVTTAPSAVESLAVTLVDGVKGDTTTTSPIKLPQSLTIKEGDAPILSIIFSTIQSFKATVSGGNVVLGWTGTSYTDPGRPDLVAVVGSIAKVSFYASSTLNTSGSYCAGGSCSSPPMGITSISVFYTADTTASIVGMQLNDSPANCDFRGPSFVNDPKGYVGVDSNRWIGWAAGSDSTYSGYDSQFAMAEATTLGASTTLYCKDLSSDPAPSGGSFASGVPDLSSNHSLGTYYLKAH